MMDGIESVENKTIASPKRSMEMKDDDSSFEPEKKKLKIATDIESKCENEDKQECENDKVSIANVENQHKKDNTLSSNEAGEKDSQKDAVLSDAKENLIQSEDSNQQAEANKLSSEFKERLTELDVGITEYLGSHTQSFTAIIKQRYSDFIVNEIDEDGNVVHLKNVTYEDKEDETEEGEEKKPADEAEEVLSEADKEVIEKIATERQKEATHDIIVPEDKELRTKVHLVVKQNYPQLETKTTEDKKGNKVIRVMWRKGRTRDSTRDEWPKSKKSCRYVRFVLYKENKDTMDAIGLIAKNLKVRESMFQYAGTKDKRGKTTQEITAHRVHPKKLVTLNKVLWNMGVGHFRYVQEPLQLGQLSGNRFIIVLRNVEKSQDVVDSALTSLKEKGFINYFGMQRFGTTSVPTHSIGSVLLKGDWERAIDLILSPRNDVPAKDKFQKIWSTTRDPAATLDATPRYCGLERNLLEALRKKIKPFNALEKLQRNTRLLYVHSYQSLVWNKMVSKRLSELGHKVVPGDLVMNKQQIKDGSKPTVVNEENIGDYSLTDVVLPLPGHDIAYPANQVREWYKELLASDGLDIDNMKRPQKDYSLSGTYRHLTLIPKDVSWSHHRYNDYTKPLTLSDFDVIQGEKLADCGDTGKLSAVVLRLSLPSSCYATMALREAMRIDTSSFQQAALNVSS